MFIQNSWYVAAWDYEIPQDGLFHRKILGRSILFYRNNDGAVVALDNRCCHRHAPLSSGRKEGDCIRCMYHGLKYDQSGSCVDIPGQSAIPKTLKLRRYPVATRTRWVWIWMGREESADPGVIPATQALDHPQWRMKPGYMHYRASYLLISDNLLDFSHLSFVHEKTLGGSNQIAESRPQVDELDNGVKITRRVSNSVIAPYQTKYAKDAGLVNRYWSYEYLVPGLLLMDSGVEAAGSDSRFQGLHFKSCQALTPESESSTHYFFMQAHDFALEDPEVTNSLYESVVAAFEEDKKMIEAQQSLIAESSPKPFIALRFDRALSLFRELVERRLKAEAKEVHSSVE